MNLIYKNIIKKIPVGKIILLFIVSSMLTSCDIIDVYSTLTETMESEKHLDEEIDLLKDFTEDLDKAIGISDSLSYLKNKDIDVSKMSPWINSNIIGILTEERKAELKNDYYLNINYNWLKDAKLRSGYSSEMPFYDIKETVDLNAMEILNDTDLSNRDLKLVKDFYELWLDFEKRNEVGLSPYKDFFKSLYEVKTLDEFSDFLSTLDNFLYGNNLTNIYLSSNSDDSNLYEVEINSTTLSLEDAAEYKKLTEYGKRKKKSVEEKAKYMLKEFMYDDDLIDTTITNFFSFETKISEFEKTILEWSDEEALKQSINPMTMEEIKNMNLKYPLVKILENSGYDKSELINVLEPNWLNNIDTVYTEENLQEMKDYILIHTLIDVMPLIDENSFRKVQSINNEVNGIYTNRDDKKLAYDSARSFFPYCFDRLYIKKYLDEDIKIEITNLCKEIIETYKTMLQENTWLSKQTIEFAIEKLDNMTINAVYPDKWEDDSIFEFKSKNEGGSYIEAVMDIVREYYERDLKKINTKRDKQLWDIDILTTNAFYKPSDNSINIVAGFLGDSTYRKDMSIEEKYGAIGTVIGHEISHAFDTFGAQYDSNGNVKSWWTDEDLKNFLDRADKLEKYYDNIIPFENGENYNGSMIKTEAIADMAGVKCILKMADTHKYFNYDKFFRTYAYLWAKVATLENLESNVLTDSHPLHYLRCNVTIQQFDEFIDIYDIKEEDKMYLAPNDRINVW